MMAVEYLIFVSVIGMASDGYRLILAGGGDMGFELFKIGLAHSIGIVRVGQKFVDGN